ncbi:MAG: hypothetical protein U1F55_03295 [Chitinivorax sp.]
MEQDGERWIVSCGSYSDRRNATINAARWLDCLKRNSAPEIHAIAQTITSARRYHQQQRAVIAMKNCGVSRPGYC